MREKYYATATVEKTFEIEVLAENRADAREKLRKIDSVELEDNGHLVDIKIKRWAVEKI